jgi:hypothetical protein
MASFLATKRAVQSAGGNDILKLRALEQNLKITRLDAVWLVPPPSDRAQPEHLSARRQGRHGFAAFDYGNHG